MRAHIVRVIDGDTILVEAMPWPDHKISTYVRLRGIDAAELTSPCKSQRDKATRARDALNHLLQDQSVVTLSSIDGDKYFGRVVADLTLRDGRRPADLLLSSGLVETYGGKTKIKRVCQA